MGENLLDGYARTIILAERRVEHRCLILQSVYACVPSAPRPPPFSCALSLVVKTLFFQRRRQKKILRCSLPLAADLRLDGGIPTSTSPTDTLWQQSNALDCRLRPFKDPFDSSFVLTTSRECLLAQGSAAGMSGRLSSPQKLHSLATASLGGSGRPSQTLQCT